MVVIVIVFVVVIVVVRVVVIVVVRVIVIVVVRVRLLVVVSMIVMVRHKLCSLFWRQSSALRLLVFSFWSDKACFVAPYPYSCPTCRRVM
jgi:hypothetical protein